LRYVLPDGTTETLELRYAGVLADPPFAGRHCWSATQTIHKDVILRNPQWQAEIPLGSVIEVIGVDPNTGKEASMLLAPDDTGGWKIHIVGADQDQ
jgi:hypothetical protein